MCSPRSPGEHEIITHQHSSERSCTATTKNVYGIRPVTRELRTRSSGSKRGFDRPPSRRGRSLPHRPRTRRRRGLTASSSSRLPRPARRYLLHRFHRRGTCPPTKTRRKVTIQTAEESTTTATAVRSSRPGKKIPIAAEFTRASKRQRETARCASRVTRSPSETDLDLAETAPTTRSAGTTTCWPQVVVYCPVQRTKHRRSPTSVQGRSPHRRNFGGTFGRELTDADGTYNRRRWGRTNQRRRQDCGLGHVRARVRPRTSASPSERM